MSKQPNEHGDLLAALEFDLSDRLAKSMRVAGLRNADMAEALGVSDTTISNYTGGRTKPTKLGLAAWALRTGAPLEWLKTGKAPASPDGDDGGQSGRLRESNSRPIHYE